MSIRVPPPTICVDTREQLPWPAVIQRAGRLALLPVVRRKLVAGDYSIEGYAGEIAIERKSLQDWVGTMFGASTSALGERASSWDRFLRETTHAYRSRVAPRAVLCRSDSLAKLGIPVLWMGSRDAASAHTMRTLIRWWAARWTEKGATEEELGAAIDAAEASAAGPPAVSTPWRGGPLGCARGRGGQRGGEAASVARISVASASASSSGTATGGSFVFRGL